MCVARWFETAFSLMHTLPPLNTSSGTFRLPLADGTAERLAGALLESELERRRRAFRAALAGDPLLAVWALVLASQEPEHVTAHLGGLAGWLAAAPLELFRGIGGDAVAAEPGDSLLDLAESAGCSLATAELAEHLAHAVHGAGGRAYLLGLVLLGPAWLHEIGGDERPRHESSLFPAWLLRDSLEVSRPRSEQSIVVACVAQALAVVSSHSEDAWRALDCVPAEWIGRWESRGRDWAASGPWPERLASLVEHLWRGWRLESDFERALEHAKLEAIKEFAYGAGHEINNPLANISARAQTLLSDETDPERRRALAAINAQAFRAHEMIADMMLFARPPEPKRQTIELAALARSVCEELRPQADEQQTELTLRLPPEAVAIEADPTQIGVALRSLCVNALEALVRGGRLQVELLAPTADEPRVGLRVSDNGPGISPEAREKLFEPYFSGREAGRGLGVGLSKCWRIVAIHGGSIELAQGDPCGAIFTILLPVSQSR